MYQPDIILFALLTFLKGVSLRIKPFLDILPRIKAAAFSQTYHPRVEEDCPCGSEERAVYRCQQCTHPPLCGSCILKAHQFSPFHRIERWNGLFFDSHSLRELGQIVCLGHNSDACPSSSAHRRITVVDYDGYHDVEIKFCMCRNRLALKIEHDEADQLFLSNLWPMTVESPQTVITVACLENFIMHANTSKLTAYDYCWALRRFTDAVEPLKVSVCDPSQHIFAV